MAATPSTVVPVRVILPSTQGGVPGGFFAVRVSDTMRSRDLLMLCLAKMKMKRRLSAHLASLEESAPIPLKPENFVLAVLAKDAAQAVKEGKPPVLVLGDDSLVLSHVPHELLLEQDGNHDHQLTPTSGTEGPNSQPKAKIKGKKNNQKKGGTAHKKQKAAEAATKKQPTRTLPEINLLVSPRYARRRRAASTDSGNSPSGDYIAPEGIEVCISTRDGSAFLASNGSRISLDRTISVSDLSKTHNWTIVDAPDGCKYIRDWSGAYLRADERGKVITFVLGREARWIVETQGSCQVFRNHVHQTYLSLNASLELFASVSATASGHGASRRNSKAKENAKLRRARTTSTSEPASKPAEVGPRGHQRQLRDLCAVPAYKEATCQFRLCFSVLQGWLKKKSRHGVHRWQPRFFVLSGDHLSYWHKKGQVEASQPAHRYNIADVKTAIVAENNKKGCRFNVEFKDGELLQLLAKDIETSQLWVETLKKVGIKLQKRNSVSVNVRSGGSEGEELYKRIQTAHRAMDAIDEHAPSSPGGAAAAAGADEREASVVLSATRPILDDNEQRQAMEDALSETRRLFEERRVEMEAHRLRQQQQSPRRRSSAKSGASDGDGGGFASALKAMANDYEEKERALDVFDEHDVNAAVAAAGPDDWSHREAEPASSAFYQRRLSELQTRLTEFSKLDAMGLQWQSPK